MRSQLTVEDMCRKLRPVIGPKVDKIFLAWRMSDNAEKRIQIEQGLNALYVKYIEKSMYSDSILLEPPTEEQVAGDYSVGKVVYAGNELHDFGLRSRDFPRHVCITGMSGSGKTNLGFHILKTFIAKDKPFIVFDWKKSFRQLMNMSDDVMLFTVGNETIANLFQTNINVPPPGVGPKEWISIIADLVNESFNASQGVHKFVSETLDEAYKEFGVYKGKRTYPTWHHIKKKLENKQDMYNQGREREWLTSAIRIAHSLTFGGFGEAVNSNDKNNIRVQDLLEKKVVFELHALGSSEKKFFCEYLLTYIYKLKKADLNQITKDFKLAIVVDEAHNIFLKEKTFFLSESITEAIYREIREYGVSLICMDQHISKLSDVVPGNSACNIAFQQMLPQDIMTSSGVMQLFEKKQYFSMLPVGSAIVRLAERYHQPFLVKVPLVQLGEHVTDREIFMRMSEVIRTYTLQRIIDQCREGAEEEEQVLIEEDSLVSISEPQRRTEEPLNDVLSAHQRIDATRHKVEKRFEKEKQKMLRKLEEKKLQEYEKQKEKELRKIATITSEAEPSHVPKNLEHEAVEKIHGPKNFITTQTLGRNKRPEGFNPHEDDFPHLGNIVTQADISQISHSLTNVQRKFAQAVGNFPELSVTELYKRLGLSSRKGNQVKEDLLQLGVIEVVEEKSARGWRKLLRLKQS